MLRYELFRIEDFGIIFETLLKKLHKYVKKFDSEFYLLKLIENLTEKMQNIENILRGKVLPRTSHPYPNLAARPQV